MQDQTKRTMGLHKRQLFNWIGRDIDRTRGLTVEDKSDRYISHLLGSLKNGLWLKKPEEDDVFGKEIPFSVCHPICCFTETSVSEIHNHTKEYGRLGLGFPRRFVMSHGGMPVHYGNDSKQNPHLKSWQTLAKILSDEQVLSRLKPKTRLQLEEEFTFVTQFLKRMKKPRQPAAKKKVTTPKGTKISKPAKAKTAASYSRKYGDTLPYLEEREWRIVLKESGKTTWPRPSIPNRSTEGPDFFLPYQTGRDLFTIVFPDNRTLAKAARHKELAQYLFPKSGPPVTLLSLENIGTY